MKKDLVIYHKDCCDGITAAACMYEKLGENANYINLTYTQNNLNDFKKKIEDFKDDIRNVYVVDFLISDELINYISDKYQSNINIFDHHLSAFKDFIMKDNVLSKENISNENLENDRFEIIRKLENNNELKYYFDNKFSGASLIHSILNPNQEMPLHIKYAEDIDLWHKVIPNSIEYVTAIGYDFFTKHPRDLYNFLNSGNNYENQVSKIVENGKNYIMEDEKRINILYENAELCEFLNPIKNKKEKTYIIKVSEDDKKLVSVVCSKLVFKEGNESGYAISYFDNVENKNIKLSIRGSEEKGVDVSQIAKEFGGNGHKYASGFYFENALEMAKFVKSINKNETENVLSNFKLKLHIR